jgi:DNA-binding response OmpR family regulator
VPKLMIIDDDINSTMLLKTLLELDGFEVAIVLRANEAVAKASQFKPDGFLIDFHLDDRSGVDLVKELRQMKSFQVTPIIMASGRDVSDQAADAGADLFLIKPYEPEQLAEHFADLFSDSVT